MECNLEKAVSNYGKNGNYQAISTVIDKGFAPAEAELVAADYLIILTAVNRVVINWGKPNQTVLSNVLVKFTNQLVIVQLYDYFFKVYISN